MTIRISAAVLLLSLSALVGCSGPTVVKTDSTVPPPAPLSLIATASGQTAFPEQAAFADFLADELSKRGYGVLNPARTSALLKKMDMDGADMESAQSAIALKGRRIDALLYITVEMATVNRLGTTTPLLDKVKIRVTGTKRGETLASFLWTNSGSGMLGSLPDAMSRLTIPAGAQKVAEALVAQIGPPGPRGTVFMDDMIAVRKSKNDDPGSAVPASAASSGLSAADIARLAKALQATAAPQERAAPAAGLPLSPEPSFQSLERPDDLAVVVGIEIYSELPKAAYAERDAAAVKAHLRALGVPERNVVFLAGAKASKSALEKNLELWLPRMAKPGSRVYFYFSGHGAPDVKTGQAYLVPWDGDPNFLEATAYPVKKLYEKLGALPAKQVLVAMDACFTGGGGRSVLASGARPLVGRVETGSVSGKVTALTASAASEISGSLDDKGHGAFTYFLLEGLDGAAKDGSGHVTTKSLLDYLTPHVKDEARRLNRDQTPQLLGADMTLR